VVLATERIRSAPCPPFGKEGHLEKGNPDQARHWIECQKNVDAGAHAADARGPVELERALDPAEALGVVAPERPRARAGVVGLVVVERHGNDVVEPVQPQRADVRRAARLHVDGPVAFQAVGHGEEGPQVIGQRVARVPLEAVEVRRGAAAADLHLNLRHAELLLQVRRELKAELVDEGAALEGWWHGF